MPRPSKKAVSRAKKKSIDPEGTCRVCIVMDKDLYKELKLASIEEGMTVSGVLRQASLEFSKRYKMHRQAG